MSIDIPLSPPPPAGRGGVAAAFLEHYGLVARIPTIRASDFALWRTCPFLYYLTRRLGLTPAIRWSRAMMRGSWIHVRFEYLEHAPESANAMFHARVDTRCDEIRDIGRAMSMSDETILSLQERERRWAMRSLAFYEAASSFRDTRYADLASGFEHRLLRPCFRHLGAEVRVAVKHPRYHRTMLVAQMDRLILNVETNSLWIVDLKTTETSTRARARTCPVDFQSRHYLFVAADALPLIAERYGLERVPSLGGIIHLIVRVPRIQMGPQDRPYIYESVGRRRGISGHARPHGRAWQVTIGDDPPIIAGTEEEAALALHAGTGKKPARIHAGEPSYERFLGRVREWYAGGGRYESLSEVHSEDPPVNFSTTAASVMDEDTTNEYLEQLDDLYEAATCPAEPRRFYRSALGMMRYEDLSELAAFYVTPIDDWPEIVRQHHLITRWRDEDIDIEATSTIIGDTP